MNIGILNGEPSGGIVDIDLDCQEAIVLAPSFLSGTITFGRASKPVSHWIFKTLDDLPKTMKFSAKNADGKESVLLEIRSTGSQTVFPPSTHPSGELIQFTSADENLSTINGDDLVNRAKRLAAACLLLRNYPAQGTRQDFALALSGTLLKGGWTTDETTHFVSTLATAAGDDEVGMRVKAVQSTADAISSNKPVTALKRLAEVLGYE
jgi:hypothetical protein